MSTLQYKGARYVPIFGRKDETSIQWDNTKPYEPLTIVLYQGNSYTSRQFVPIGIDILNQTYWALTGNYNAQVESIRQQVENLEDDVEEAQEAITTLQGNVTEIQGDVTEIQGDVTEIQGDITEIQGDITEIQGDITTIQGDITTLQGNVINLSNNKLNKLNTNSIVYANDNTGAPIAVSYTTSENANSIAYRDNNGNLKVGTATNGKDALNLETFQGQIVDNLTTVTNTKPLSAKQGKILKDNVDTLDNRFSGVNSKTLIWTNASPTSSFAPQTIVNASDYDSVLIVASTSGTLHGKVMSIVDKGEKNMIFSNVVEGGSSWDGIVAMIRTLQFNNNGNVVAEGGVQAWNDEHVSQNSVIIPYKIYGIKGA